VSFEGADGVFVEGGGEDDGGGLFDELEHFEAVDLGHLDVEEDEVGVQLLDGFDAFEAVAAFLDDLDPGIVLEVFADDQTGEGFVVDEDGPDGCGRDAGWCGCGVAWCQCCCGIFTVVVNKLLSIWVSSRSGLAKIR
jgi:hypothetical protein